MNELLTFKELIKKQNEMQKYAHKCKCGHTVMIVNKSGMAVCTHCKNMVFKNKEIEFKYRMKEKIAKVKRSKNG